MWKLALNNLKPESNTPVPSRTEVLESRRKARIAQGKKWIANIQCSTQKEAANLLEVDSLSRIPKGTHFFTIDPGVWAGEIMSIYEVEGFDGKNLVINCIYAEADDFMCYDPSSPYNEQKVDLKWIQENALAIPVSVQSPVRDSLQLLGYREPQETLPTAILWASSSLLVNEKLYRPYHRKDIQKLSGMFLAERDSWLIQELESGWIQVQGAQYEVGYAYNGEPLPRPIVWDGYWFSKSYEYILEEIFRRYAWKKIIIRYKWVIFQKVAKSYDYVNVEYDAPLIKGQIWEIKRQVPRAHKQIALLDALQDSTPLEYIPREVFLTGFTVELDKEDRASPYSLKNFMRDITRS